MKVEIESFSVEYVVSSNEDTRTRLAFCEKAVDMEGDGWEVWEATAGIRDCLVQVGFEGVDASDMYKVQEQIAAKAAEYGL